MMDLFSHYVKNSENLEKKKSFNGYTAIEYNGQKALDSLLNIITQTRNEN